MLKNKSLNEVRKLPVMLAQETEALFKNSTFIMVGAGKNQAISKNDNPELIKTMRALEI
jgi:hypothetical protein